MKPNRNGADEITAEPLTIGKRNAECLDGTIKINDKRTDFESPRIDEGRATQKRERKHVETTGVPTPCTQALVAGMKTMAQRETNGQVSSTRLTCPDLTRYKAVVVPDPNGPW